METSLVSDILIEALRCPSTKQRLHRATAETLAPFRSAQADLRDALITEDGLRAYPIEDGFPILLLERAVVLSDSN